MIVYEDLLKISEALREIGYGEEDFEIAIPVLTKERMQKVNEEIFYAVSKDNNEQQELSRNVDEININVGNIRFRYFLTEK